MWRNKAYELNGTPLPWKPRIDQGPDYERGFVDGMQYQMQSSVDTAVNRMAQPKHEPVIGTKTWLEDGKVVTQHLTAKDIYKDPEQPEQEPVALVERFSLLLWDYQELERAFEKATGGKWIRKSNTPQRTWVGLTGFEQKELMAMNARDAVFATEAKLREKNT